MTRIFAETWSRSADRPISAGLLWLIHHFVYKICDLDEGKRFVGVPRRSWKCWAANKDVCLYVRTAGRTEHLNQSKYNRTRVGSMSELTVRPGKPTQTRHLLLIYKQTHQTCSSIQGVFVCLFVYFREQPNLQTVYSRNTDTETGIIKF